MWNAQSHQIWQKSRPVAFNLASDTSTGLEITMLMSISLALGFMSRTESGILFWTPIAAGGMFSAASNRRLVFSGIGARFFFFERYFGLRLAVIVRQVLLGIVFCSCRAVNANRENDSKENHKPHSVNHKDKSEADG
jgi:hypothetical protein